MEQIQEILIDLIDDPVLAMRTQLDEQGLQDLAESIRTNGLIQPIVLKRTGDRYEVVAGHRRLRAHKLIQKTHVQAIVKNYTDAQAESAKVHENLFREDVNPVDQATFMARYIERTKCDLQELARMLNRTTEWVSSRLEILRYPDYLIDEVYNGKISLGVARWLNEIPSEAIKKEYTRFAALQGINIKTAKRWSELAAAGTLPENPTTDVLVTDMDGAQRLETMITCVMCTQQDKISNLTTDFLHVACREEYTEEMRRSLAALPVEPVATPPL